MSFKITIEETKQVEKDIGHEWKVLKPATNDEEEVRGYTPSEMAPRNERTSIFEQVVEDMDLVQVILAVNNCAPNHITK